MKAYPNSTKDARTLEIVVSGREMRPIHRESKFVILFNHPPHGDVEEAFECWAIQRFIQVTTEGRQEDFFDQEVPAGVQAQEPQQPNTGNENAANNNNNNHEEQDLPEELQQIVNATTAAGVQGDDVGMVCNLVDGSMIDDDNAPAPENIPTPNDNTDGIFGEWEHSGSCYRALAGGRHLKARISYPPHIKPSLFNMFELFFFTSFMKDVIIPQTNTHLTANGIHHELSYGEFLWWIGVWLLMSMLHGPDHATFWSLMDVNHF